MNPWTITAQPNGHRWKCWHCESGTGAAPTRPQAEQDAATHHRAVHSNQGETP